MSCSWKGGCGGAEECCGWNGLVGIRVVAGRGGAGVDVCWEGGV